MGSNPQFSISVPKGTESDVREQAKAMIMRLSALDKPLILTQSALFRAALGGELAVESTGTYLKIKVGE